MTRTMPLVLAALTVACGAETHYVQTNASPRALRPRPVEEVAVFTTTTPERPYIEVGIVSSRSGTAQIETAPSKATLIEKVREEAARQGCDGVIYAPGSALLAEATCIVYK